MLEAQLQISESPYFYAAWEFFCIKARYLDKKRKILTFYSIVSWGILSMLEAEIFETLKHY